MSATWESEKWSCPWAANGDIKTPLWNTTTSHDKSCLLMNETRWVPSTSRIESINLVLWQPVVGIGMQPDPDMPVLTTYMNWKFTCSLGMDGRSLFNFSDGSLGKIQLIEINKNCYEKGTNLKIGLLLNFVANLKFVLTFNLRKNSLKLPGCILHAFIDSKVHVILIQCYSMPSKKGKSCKISNIAKRHGERAINWVLLQGSKAVLHF